MIQSPSPVDHPPPPSPIDSHHRIDLSVLIVFLILIVAILITVTISYLIRRLCAARSPLPRSLGDCSICLSSFKPNDHLRQLPICCHAFHDGCISTWLISNKTCPLCRSPLDRAAAETESMAESIGHDGSRSWLRDLSRGLSSRALSFRSSGRFFTGSSRRGGTVAAVDLEEAGGEITEYFGWLSTL